jgi:hypothetical protein
MDDSEPGTYHKGNDPVKCPEKFLFNEIDSHGREKHG